MIQFFPQEKGEKNVFLVIHKYFSNINLVIFILKKTDAIDRWLFCILFMYVTGYLQKSNVACRVLMLCMYDFLFECIKIQLEIMGDVNDGSCKKCLSG